MNKQFYLFMLVILCVNTVFSQTNQGSRLTAMGNNGGAVKDVWGVAANPAIIVDISSLTIQLSHKEHYFSKAIRNQAIAIVYPVNRQIFGLNFQRYGIPEYHTIKIGMVATRQFGPKLAIGLRANYHQLKIDDYGATTGFSLDIGTIYQLSDELTFGAYLNNFSKQSYRTKIIYSTIPSKAFIGIAYRTSSTFLIASTISKDIVAVGFDYQIAKALSLRGGVSFNPLTHYFGIGFAKSKLLADFTFTKHPNFDYSPQLTIGYVF